MATMQSVELDAFDGAIGPLVRSGRDEPAEELRCRLGDDGYIYLPSFFAAEDVDRAVAIMTTKLGSAGLLDPRRPASDLVARPGLDSTWLDGLTDDNPPLHELIYGPETMAFFSRLLGGPARHFDYTWSRVVSRGNGTAPHCDVVFMGRGTPDVVTMWTALVDIPEHVGGLAILAGSHRAHPSLAAYRSFDVDTYCENLGDEPTPSWGAGGSLPCEDANELRRRVDGRWLWAHYGRGDVLLFGLGTVHASLDNHSPQLRLSTDTRYQLASEPIDERWVGPSPLAHGPGSQRPTIC